MFDTVIETYQKTVRPGVNPNFPENHMKFELHAKPDGPTALDFNFHFIIRLPYNEARGIYFSGVSESLPIAIEQAMKGYQKYLDENSKPCPTSKNG